MVEKFKNGDKVYLLPEYQDKAGERFTLSQYDDERGRGWIGDSSGAGWYVHDYQITKKKPKKNY